MLKSDLSLEHVIRESSIRSGKAPLLIMLHGYGSDENDLFSFSSELPEELFIISLKAPYSLEPFGHAWYAINFDAQQNKWSNTEQAIKSRDLVAKFIDEAIEHYPVKKENLTLLGFSQGTVLSYAVAFMYPEKVQNIVALSGYIDKDLLPDKADVNGYKHLDFYCSHGVEDQVIPVDWARRAQPFLNSLNIKNKYSEFPVGHGVAPQNFYEFKEWLKNRL
ncbi:MAG: alpha/beta fold hydrolase [Flavobacteriaceae bacterium]|nr:alpha/beta fold hydrolase [Bacteroidia bacterium]NNL16867.1 alpha/beta fold hydrolase [Flavobacteriaceae bacterium]